MKIIYLFITLFMGFCALAQPAGYGFGKAITIDATKVSGSAALSNFPVLISITDPDLRTIANGGKVRNNNGFDITFTQTNCNSALLFDLESYSPTTGKLVAWVQVPSLSNSTNTRFFMYYGNSSASTNQSTTAIWSTLGYDGIWHLNNNVNDRSGSSNNGTNNGSTNRSPALIGDGRNFVDPNHWIELSNHPNRTSSFSYSAWMRTTTNNQSGQRIFCDDAINDGGGHAISLGDPGTGAVRFYIRGLTPVSLDSPTNSIFNNTWHFVAATYNNVTKVKRLYIDGALISSATVTGTLTGASGNASIGGEIASGENANRFNGDLDEVRASATVLSTDWLATEFNNQKNPTTFLSVSTEYTAAALCAALPIDLLNFEATINFSNRVVLEWNTASEINNDFFSIERSNYGTDWEVIKTIKGAGNSSKLITYTAIDENPIDGWSYYQLKQTDFNGDSEYFEKRSVFINTLNGATAKIFPNPAYSKVTLNGDISDLKSITVFTIYGQEVTQLIDQSKSGNSTVVLDVSHLKNGIYIIRTNTSAHQFIKQ